MARLRARRSLGPHAYQFFGALGGRVRHHHGNRHAQFAARIGHGQASIAAAAQAAGIDDAAATAFLRAPGAQQEIERNLGFARQLGVSGTPAWAIGGSVLSGALGREKLQNAIDLARKG